MSVPNTELVVGDIVEISEGKIIQADCILCESTDLSTDESSLTGETKNQFKRHVEERTYY